MTEPFNVREANSCAPTSCGNTFTLKKIALKYTYIHYTYIYPDSRKIQKCVFGRKSRGTLYFIKYFMIINLKS